MAKYCQNCGAEMQDAANFCPQCGASVSGTGAGTAQKSGTSDTVKTAATVGGVVLGASVLSGMLRSMTHRPRPMYRGPMGGPHMGGPRGPRGPHGPGGRW